MKVQSVQQKNNLTNVELHPQFKGGVDTAFRFLATNQAVGANCVDFCFMVAPRTVNDGIQRGPAAGMETGRREIMGTVNDSCVGLFGAASGAAIAYGINKKYGSDINRMFTAPETLNILAENRAEQLKHKKKRVDYIKSTLKNVRAYNPAAKNADKEGYVKLSKQTINEVSKNFDELITNKVKYVDWIKDKNDKSRRALMNRIIEDTGAESTYILESADKKIVSNTNLKSLLNDIFIVSDSFNNEKVQDAFKEQIKS